MIDKSYEVIVRQANPIPGGPAGRARWEDEVQVTIKLPFLPYPGMQLMDIGTHTGLYMIHDVVYGTKTGYITILVN